VNNKFVKIYHKTHNYYIFFKSYYECIFKNGGAVLFAVCNEQLKTLLDGRDETVRSFIMIEIPLPMFLDPKIILKRYSINKLARTTC